jgi:hypothetical protein
LVDRLCKQSGSPWYIVTDPDLDFSQTPADFLGRLKDALLDHPGVVKVGLSLRLDDIPELSPLYHYAHLTEAEYWKRLTPGNCYVAGVDTTFALYRSHDRRPGFAIRPAVRTPPPYSVRHLPWYQTAREVTAEDRWRIARSCTGFNGHKLLEAIGEKAEVAS